MWRGTGCDSSTAFKALVSPPPVQSAAEARSFEDVVAGKTNQLYLRCNCVNCVNVVCAKVTPEHVRATRGDIAQLLPQLPKCRGGSSQFHPNMSYYWQPFFDAAWAWVKTSDDHEHAMAEHSSRSIFGLVRTTRVKPSNTL